MKISLFFVLLFSVSLQAADNAKSGPTKSKLNTQIYEKDSDEASFEAVVKTVREVQGETEVFFEGQQGFFTLASESSQPLLVNSQKKKFPVRVRINRSSRQVLSVETSSTGN